MAIRLTEAAVRAVFDAATCQEDYIIGLHKLVLPDWDQIEKLDGFIKCNEFTSKAIFAMAIEWDQKHVSSMPGGAWLNYGFSTRLSDSLPNWHVSLKDCPITYKQPVCTGNWEQCPCSACAAKSKAWAAVAVRDFVDNKLVPWLETP